MELKSFGFSNTELEYFFKKNGRNLSENFAGVIPADKKREFLDEISGKERKYPFMVANIDSARKPGIGGRFWILNKRTLYLFLTALVVPVY